MVLISRLQLLIPQQTVTEEQMKNRPTGAHVRQNDGLSIPQRPLRIAIPRVANDDDPVKT